MSPLAFACSKGEIIKVEELIDSGADVNAITSRGNTAAMIAFRFGHFEIVKLLMATPGFNYFVKSRYGVLFSVLISANAELFEIFLQNNLNNPEIEQVYVQILFSCCINNNIKAIRALLTSQAVPVEIRKIDKYMAFNLLRYGNVESVNLIAELSKYFEFEYSNLHYPAAAQGLIEYFEHFPAKLSDYPIVLRAALRGCHQNILNHLQSAKPEAFDEYLIVALRIVSKHAVNSNIEYLFNLAKKKFSSDEETFINLANKAIANNQIEIFNKIVEYKKGSKVFKASFEEFSVTAAKSNRLEFLKLILALNPKIHLKSALSSAVFKGHIEIVKHLISHGQFSPEEQESILMESIRSKSKNCTVLLMESGFKTSKTNELFTKAAGAFPHEQFHEFVLVYLKNYQIDPKFTKVQKSSCALQ